MELDAHEIMTIRYAAEMLDVVRREWKEEGGWSKHDENVRKGLGAILVRALEDSNS